MSVYFVFRDCLAGPGCKHVHRIEADSILEVFQANWHDLGRPDEPEAVRRCKLAFGPGHYCLDTLAYEILDERLPVPESLAELHAHLQGLENREVLEALRLGEHHLAILHTDDVVEFALYIFDEHYSTAYPERVAFLLHEGWPLPVVGDETGEFVPVVDCRIEDGGREAGCTLLVYLGVEEVNQLRSLHLGEHRHCCRIENVRLSGVAPLLIRRRDSINQRSSWLLRHLAAGLHHFAQGTTGIERAFLDAIMVNPADRVNWMAYSDWLADLGRPSAESTLLTEALRRCSHSPWNPVEHRPEDEVIIHPHIAQSTRLGKYLDQPSFSHVVLFDDRWAAANRDLANSILRYASRWDCL